MGVVDLANSLVGKVDYVFGADNIENGVGDCSSFTQYVFKQNGVDIGRDTRTQLSNVDQISQEDLKEGDLVFFEGTYREGVSHVGIYIGDGQFVHNSSSGGTVVSNLSDSYYQNHFLTGGRVSGVKNNNVINTSTSTTKTSWGEKVLDWLGFNDIMKNISVIIIVALCVVGAIIFFLGAWDINTLEKVNPLSKIM